MLENAFENAMLHAYACRLRIVVARKNTSSATASSANARASHSQTSKSPSSSSHSSVAIEGNEMHALAVADIRIVQRKGAKNAFEALFAAWHAFFKIKSRPRYIFFDGRLRGLAQRKRRHWRRCSSSARITHIFDAVATRIDNYRRYYSLYVCARRHL